MVQVAGVMQQEKSVGNQQKFLDNFADYLVGACIGNMPHFPLFNSVKSLLMRSRGATVGQRVKLLSGIWIDRFSAVTLEDDVSLAKDVVMVAAGGIHIGARSMVGYRSTILSVNHIIPSGRGSMRFSGALNQNVAIENDVWVGAHVVILPGVKIGEGAIVGAGAVVTKDVLPFHVVGGVPARTIKVR